MSYTEDRSTAPARPGAPRRVPAGLAVAVSLALFAGACGNTEAVYPTKQYDRPVPYDPQGRVESDRIFGEGGLSILGDDEDEAGGAGIGVNAYLWRASLDTLSFMPLESADPFGGVILTEWYAAPDTPNERTKATVYILDRRLRADGLRVSVFRQVRNENGEWVNAPVSRTTETRLEDTILTRARQLRIADVG